MSAINSPLEKDTLLIEVLNQVYLQGRDGLTT